MDTTQDNYFFYDGANRDVDFYSTAKQARDECEAAIRECLSPDGWGADEDDLQSFVVGAVTHRAEVVKHIGTDKECEELGLDPQSEIWEVPLREVKPDAEKLIADAFAALHPTWAFVDAEQAMKIIVEDIRICKDKLDDKDEEIKRLYRGEEW